MLIELKWQDNKLELLAQAFATYPKQSATALQRALNRTGEKTRNQMVKVLRSQTGLPAKTVKKALRPTKAMKGVARYVIDSEGGDIRLKFFRPIERRKGVVAYPWGKATTFPGHFMKGGRFPKRTAFRKALKPGNVYFRTGSGKFPVRQGRSHLFIPEEMMQGATAGAFWSYSAALPDAILAQLAYLLPGK